MKCTVLGDFGMLGAFTVALEYDYQPAEEDLNVFEDITVTRGSFIYNGATVEMSKETYVMFEQDCWDRHYLLNDNRN